MFANPLAHHQDGDENIRWRSRRRRLGWTTPNPDESQFQTDLWCKFV